MSRDTQRSNKRATHWLGFWLVILVVCAGVGYGSYVLGKDVIGTRLAKEGTPIRDLSGESSVSLEPVEGDEGPWGGGVTPPPPPPEPIVEIEEIESEELPEQPAEAEAEATADKPTADEPEMVEEPEAAESEGEPEAARAEEPSSEPAAPPVVEERTAARRYVVRAGSFKTREALESRVRELKSLGYRPWETKIERDGVEYTRVNVAEFTTPEEAEQLQRELAALDIDAEISEE